MKISTEIAGLILSEIELINSKLESVSISLEEIKTYTNSIGKTLHKLENSFTNIELETINKK
jgi:hypothetical protein